MYNKTYYYLKSPWKQNDRNITLRVNAAVWLCIGGSKEVRWVCVSNYLILSRSHLSYLTGKPFLLKSNIYDQRILSLMYKGIPI